MAARFGIAKSCRIVPLPLPLPVPSCNVLLRLLLEDPVSSTPLSLCFCSGVPSITPSRLEERDGVGWMEGIVDSESIRLSDSITRTPISRSSLTFLLLLPLPGDRTLLLSLSLRPLLADE